MIALNVTQVPFLWRKNKVVLAKHIDSSNTEGVECAVGAALLRKCGQGNKHYNRPLKSTPPHWVKMGLYSISWEMTLNQKIRFSSHKDVDFELLTKEFKFFADIFCPNFFRQVCLWVQIHKPKTF